MAAVAAQRIAPALVATMEEDAVTKRPQRPEPGRGMIANAGYQPDHSKGRRVRVVFASGRECDEDGLPADSCDWSFHKMPDGSPYPFDIAQFEVL